jgi:hypothetical protein
MLAMKNDEFLAHLREKQHNEDLATFFCTNKKTNKVMIADFIVQYQAELDHLMIPKLSMVFNEPKIEELKSIISILNEILIKLK